MPSFRAFEKTIVAGGKETFTVDFLPDSWVVSTANTWIGRVACYPGASVPRAGAFVLPSAGSANVPGLGEKILTIQNGTSSALDFNVIAAKGLPVGGVSFLPSGGGVGTYDLILIRDVKSQNTNGGSSSSGAWRTRDLNAKDVDTGGYASLSANQITLLPGTYRVVASAPCFRGERNQIRIQNISLGTTLIVGDSNYASQASSVENRAFLSGQFTISSNTLIELQHQVELSIGVNGWGVACNFTSEVYSEIALIREPG